MCFVLQNHLGKGRCAPVASPAKWRFPIPFPKPPVGRSGKGRISAIGETSLSPQDRCGGLSPSTRGVPDPLEPSRLRRGMGAFLLPLTP